MCSSSYPPDCGQQLETVSSLGVSSLRSGITRSSCWREYSDKLKAEATGLGVSTIAMAHDLDSMIVVGPDRSRLDAEALPGRLR